MSVRSTSTTRITSDLTCEAPLFFALPASFVDIQRGRPNLVWVVRRLHAVTYARDGRNTLARTFS